MSSALLGLACGSNTPNASEPEVAASAESPSSGTLPSASASQQTENPPKDSVKTLLVREFLVACTGEGEMQCMQVRESETDDWTYFYQSIIGFDYEEGFRYELKVRVEEVENPPAGGSSLKYHLLEQVSKRAVDKDSQL